MGKDPSLIDPASKGSLSMDTAGKDPSPVDADDMSDTSTDSRTEPPNELSACQVVDPDELVHYGMVSLCEKREQSESGPLRWGPQYLYHPRPSLLDRVFMRESGEMIRGFFNLLWVFAAFFTAASFVSSMRMHGSALNTSLFYLSTTHLGDLFFWDACMILGMTPIVLWCKACSLGWIPAGPIDWGTRLAFELIFTGVGLQWTRTSTWPWVQRTFFSLHTMVLAMKIHSYGARNAIFREKKDELSDLEEEERILSSHTLRGPHETQRYREVTSRVEELQMNLRCTKDTIYPDNLTIRNWADYLALPVLIYELSYPRTTRIRPGFVLEKFLGTVGCIFLLYTCIESHAIPYLHVATHKSFWVALPQLLPVFLVIYLLGFYIIFEGICPGFAEISRFADRHFYDDWWNSDSWDQFARRWNKPVHHFLLRHIYHPLRDEVGMTKSHANFATFLFSSIFHEIFMYVVVGQPKGFLFAMQMCQLPLTWMGNVLGRRFVTFWGNAIFWIGLSIGPVLLTYGYTVDYLKEMGKAEPGSFLLPIEGNDADTQNFAL
ncbi:MAG: MBOAT, membrane-bound O-acyltransferase family-domain-containing protein [Piptocephalis tieghemiana]|nr:MAG: MBOAT, membrane-bound O-acyltransferase family-domain-containing protein [Piptocephalis tieghemiana]